MKGVGSSMDANATATPKSATCSATSFFLCLKMKGAKLTLKKWPCSFGASSLGFRHAGRLAQSRARAAPNGYAIFDTCDS